MKFKKIFFYILDIFFSFYLKLLTSKNNVQDLVIIRTDAIGDYVLWVSALEQIIQSHKGKKITLIGNDQWTSLASNMHPDIKVIGVNLKKLFSLSGRYIEISKLKDIQAESVWYTVYSRVYLTGDSLALLISANTKIAFDGDLANSSGVENKITRKIYSTIIDSDKASKMEIQRNYEFAEKALNQRFSNAPPSLSKLNLPENKLNSGYVILFVGASWGGKRWPLSRFLKLADCIKIKMSLNVVFCGTLGDIPNISKEDQAQIDSYTNLIGKTNLLELLAVIKEARLVVSNDTSALHFASGFTVPTVGILGGGHFGRFAPWTNAEGVKQNILFHKMDCYNCNWNCKFSVTESGCVVCIDNISYEQVREAVESTILGQSE